MVVSKGKGIPAIFYGWIIVAASTVVMALVLGMLHSFGVFFKPIGTEFQWTRDVVAVAYSIYAVVEGITTPVSGYLTDKYGPRVVIAASGVLAGLGYFLMAQTQSLWQFCVYFGLLVGLSGGAAYAPLVATVNRWFVEKRGLAQGIVVSGVGVGTVVMPPLAAYLIESFRSWRMAYIFLAALLGVGMIGASIFLRRSPQERGLLPYGQTAVAHSAQSKVSLSLRQALRRRVFWLIFLIGAFGFWSVSLVMVHLVNYATDPGVGLSAEVAATFLSVIGVASIAGRVGMGTISDYIGRKATLLICFGLGAIVAFFLPWAKSLWMLYVFSAIYGFAYGGWIPVLPAIVGDHFGVSSIGTIFGLTSLGGSFGGGIGAYLGGAIFEATQGYTWAFILGAGVLVVAAFLALFIKAPTEGARKFEAEPRRELGV